MIGLGPERGGGDHTGDAQAMQEPSSGREAGMKVQYGRVAISCANMDTSERKQVPGPFLQAKGLKLSIGT